ncbi:hypothetical protein YC2023_009434 [Brassica napus]
MEAATWKSRRRHSLQWRQQNCHHLERSARNNLSRSAFISSPLGFSDLDLICRFFRSGRLLGRLSRLKYNALDDFHFSRLDFHFSRLDFLEVVWTSWKSSEEVSFS